MMYQHGPFHDFDIFERKPPGGSPARWIVPGVMFAISLVAVAAAGYGLGRGTWEIPSSVSSSIPAPLAAWLQTARQPAASAGPGAELKDYEFQLVKSQTKQGEAELAVRLIDKRSGKPVPDAVIFARRLDMAPEGMPTMTALLEPQPAQTPGVYRFKTNLMMKGDWRLSLAAKVQGETGTVQNQLVLKAVP